MTFVHIRCTDLQVVAIPAYLLHTPIYGLHWSGVDWYADFTANGMLSLPHSFVVR